MRPHPKGRSLAGLPAGGRRLAILVIAAGTILQMAACASLSSRAVTTGDLASRLSGFAWPLPIEAGTDVTSPYGPRGRRHHDGLDLRAAHGAPIHAAADGAVRISGWRGGYGNTVILAHSGDVETLYAHASTLLVRPGQRVRRGQVIARVGASGNATGPHLHFEVRWADFPIDPRLILPRLAD